MQSGRRAHSISREFTQAGIGFAGFIRVRVGLLTPAKWLQDSVGLAGIQSGAPRGHRLHSGSLGFSFARQVVDGFIHVLLGPLV